MADVEGYIRFADLLHRDPLEVRDNMCNMRDGGGLVPSFDHGSFLPPFFLHGLGERRRSFQVFGRSMGGSDFTLRRSSQ